MAFFDDLKAVVAIVDKANEPTNIDFEHLVHIAYDVSFNAYLAMATEKMPRQYANGVRDGLDALLLLLVKDHLKVDSKEALRIVHDATTRCYEDHKKMYEKSED